MATGLSIHIGLNHVDPNAYNGWDGALAGCINDANDMQAIAASMGYQSLVLTESAATSSRVISEIGHAAQSLASGDILFLSYSGHGGQVPDVNNDETDAQDETWVLWDRQVIDDELYALWSQFAPGVRIVVLSDSCHSGTVLRMMATYNDLKREIRRSRGAPTDGQRSVLASLDTALRTADGSSGSGDPGGHRARDRKGRYSRTAEVLTGARASGGATAVMENVAIAEPPVMVRSSEAILADTESIPTSRMKTIPPDVRDLVNRTRAAENSTLQWLAGPSEKAVVSASVILISGCQDDQLSMDGTGNGLFTQNVKAAWNSGAFSGDYPAFWSDILGRMPANQQPNYATTGAANPGFEAQRPFTINGGGGGGTSGGGVTTARPTLRRSSSGPDVTYLQQKLVEAGYSLTVDGDFGYYTEHAVIQFQSAHGLTADGVVGPMTWNALEGAAGPGPTPTPEPEPEPYPTPASGRPTLRLGSQGPDVRYLQSRLTEYGHNLTIDGNFGPMTAAAVRSFQQTNGLTADGVVGPQTWAALG